MTDYDRIELFKTMEVTEDDLRDLIEDGYDYTEEEVALLSTKLQLINKLVVGAFVEYRERELMIDIIDEILPEALTTSEGIIRRRFPDIFEYYLDNLDEDEYTQRLLNDVHLCVMVMARYKKYWEHCSHADAMHNAIEDTLS